MQAAEEFHLQRYIEQVGMLQEDLLGKERRLADKEYMQTRLSELEQVIRKNDSRFDRLEMQYNTRIEKLQELKLESQYFALMQCAKIYVEIMTSAKAASASDFS